MSRQKRRVVICPCGEHYSIPHDFAGKVLECDACGKPFQVPPLTPPKKPAPPPRRRFFRRRRIAR